MEIIELIRKNKLIYLTQEKLVKALKLLTGVGEDEVKGQIVSLIHSGELFLDENGKISITKDRGFLLAKLSVNKKGYGFASVEGMNDIFIPAYAIGGAFSGDDCFIEIINHKSDDEIEGRVVKVLRRNTTHVVGTFVEGKSKNVVFPDDETFPQIRIYKNDVSNARNNDKVWVELNLDSLEAKLVTGKIVEVLGKANTPKAEQLSIIRSFKLSEKFDDATLQCAKAISQKVELKDFPHRADYTAMRVITIDGEDARDFDDALSIEKEKCGGYTLYVHIADVSNYVVEGSALDKEAYNRGTSVYFPNQVIPMLPKELSNGICSLSEGVNRLVLTVEITLSDKFDVLSSRVREGVIKSAHRMTYTEITNILAGDELLREKYEDVLEDIDLYRAISNKLKKDRASRGEMRMNLPEPFILENEQGEIVSIENRVQDEAHEIIESLMILANECVAKKYYDLKLPFVYRVHEKPDEDKVLRLSELLKNMGVANTLTKDGDKPASYQKIIDKIAGDTKERTLTKLILRSMMKARYAPTCLGHFGLASEFYCHFTSPIRRYPDLMIHRIIKEYLHGVPVDELKSKFTGTVERVSLRSSETEKNADEAEREVDDYKKALYMTKFLGEQFTGTISGVQSFGIFVELENGVEGLVRVDSLPYDEYTYDEMSLTMTGNNNSFTIGDKVDIIVANANTHLRQIDFDLVGVENSLKNFVVKKGENKKSLGKNLKNGKKPYSKSKKSTRNSDFSAKSYYKQKNSKKKKHK